MKNTFKVIIAFILIAWASLTYSLYQGYNKLERKLSLQHGITFIWNDDLESVPTDNSLITLEFTDENTVFIGPYDKNAKAE